MEKLQKRYYRLGSIFFGISSVYIGCLIWKTYVWWRWLESLQHILDLNNEGLML
jgi:hypothetical protein